MGSAGDRWVLLEGVIGFALWTIMSAGRLAATAVDGGRSAGSMPDRRQGAASIEIPAAWARRVRSQAILALHRQGWKP